MRSLSGNRSEGLPLLFKLFHAVQRFANGVWESVLADGHSAFASPTVEKQRGKQDVVDNACR